MRLLLTLVLIGIAAYFILRALRARRSALIEETARRITEEKMRALEDRSQSAREKPIRRDDEPLP